MNMTIQQMAHEYAKNNLKNFFMFGEENPALVMLELEDAYLQGAKDAILLMAAKCSEDIIDKPMKGGEA